MEEQNKKPMDNQEQQLLFSKLTMIFTGSILAVVVLSALILVPKAITTLNRVNSFIEDAKVTLSNADTALEDIATMSTTVTTDISTITTEFTTFLKEDATAITGAAEGIETIDFEGLNDAIQDLEDAVEPFANFMNRLKGLTN